LEILAHIVENWLLTRGIADRNDSCKWDAILRHYFASASQIVNEETPI